MYNYRTDGRCIHHLRYFSRSVSGTISDLVLHYNMTGSPAKTVWIKRSLVMVVAPPKLHSLSFYHYALHYKLAGFNCNVPVPHIAKRVCLLHARSIFILPTSQNRHSSLQEGENTRQKVGPGHVCQPLIRKRPVERNLNSTHAGIRSNLYLSATELEANQCFWMGE